MIREHMGPKAGLIVCLSGPFCQRGVPALLDKGLRAGLALSMGADLVLELPTAFAAASAERFAQGAVGTLLATGVVRKLAYGTERPEDHEAIRQVGALLAQEPPALGQAIRQGIAEGKGFAAARQDALAQISGRPDLASLLGESNTILAVEYEKALARTSPLPSLALPLIDKAARSASLIRDQVWTAWQKGSNTAFDLARDLSRTLPADSLAALLEVFTSGRGLVFEEALAPSLLLSPVFFDRDRLNLAEGMQGGLGDRIYKALAMDPIQALPDDPLAYSKLADRLASRSHPASRVRRAILAAALGVEAGDQALTKDQPTYIRVLGFNRQGRRLLSFMRKEARLPLIVQASDFRKLKDPAAVRQAALDLRAQAIWNQAAGLGRQSEFQRTVRQVR